MLLSIRRASKPFFDWIAGLMANSQIKATEVTLCGFTLGIWSFVMLAYNHYGPALVFIILNRLADGLDGAVARQSNNETDIGQYLDIVLDFIFYTGIFFFFAVGMPHFTFTALLVTAAFAIDYMSLTAFSIFAERKKMSAKNARSLYPLGGLMDGTETFVIVALLCLVPNAFMVTGLIYALLAVFATILRVTSAAKVLNSTS